MAIDNELEDEQKAKRIQEVHTLCETFKDSELNKRNMEIAGQLPLSCDNQPILQEIESIEFFEKHNILYKFWKSMFSHNYPTSFWIQLKTLISRSFTVLMRDARLTVAPVHSNSIPVNPHRSGFHASKLFAIGHYKPNLRHLFRHDDRVLFAPLLRNPNLSL